MQRIKKLVDKKEVRFIIVGGFNTLVGYLLLLLLSQFIAYQIAYPIAFVLGIILNYFTHKHATFRTKGNVKRELPRFITVYICLFLIGLGLLYCLVDVLLLPDYLAFLIQTILIAILSYLGQNYISFRNYE